MSFMGNIANSPLGLILPLALGIGSAFSPYVRRGAGPALSAMKLLGSFSEESEKKKRMQDFMKSIAGQPTSAQQTMGRRVQDAMPQPQTATQGSPFNMEALKGAMAKGVVPPHMVPQIMSIMNQRQRPHFVTHGEKLFSVPEAGGQPQEVYDFSGVEAQARARKQAEKAKEWDRRQQVRQQMKSGARLQDIQPRRPKPFKEDAEWEYYKKGRKIYRRNKKTNKWQLAEG